MGTARAPAAVSGCPTATTPVAAREGMLMRLLVPAGRLPTDAFALFAAGCAAVGVATLDITNRANLQIRGLSPTQADDLAGLARRCGLLPAAHADRRRAIVASPLAGLDPAETVDPMPVIAALDTALLGCAASDRLSPKVGFGVDGGGAHVVRRRSLDLVFEAAGGDWRIVAAGRDLGLAVTDVPGAARAVVERLVRSDAARTRDLPPVALIEAIRERVAARTLPPAAARAATAPLVGPIALDDDRVVLGAVVPFGALSVAAASAVAAIAGRHGIAEIRLSPDRAILLAGMPHAAVQDAVAALAAAGLSTDPATPFAVLHACVGIDGCLRAETDVRAVARAIADALGPVARAARHIHVSGCARGCAHPRRADILLLATGSGRYSLQRDADARSGDGIELASGLAPGEVVAAVVDSMGGAAA